MLGLMTCRVIVRGTLESTMLFLIFIRHVSFNYIMIKKLILKGSIFRITFGNHIAYDRGVGLKYKVL